MKKRLISAAVILCITVPLIYFGGSLFYVFSILISLMGLHEIINLFVKNKFVKVFSYLSLLSIIISNLYKVGFTNLLDYKLLCVILLLSAVVMLFDYKDSKFDVEKCFSLLGIVVFLGISFSIIIINRNIGLQYFVYLLLISCITDTFAHLIGSSIGMHKINSISPNKSWEGALGGLIFGSIISSVYYLIFINSFNPFKIVFISMFLSVMGQLGDLFFSLIKRHYGVKDYSNLIPGHGGILDRLDSIIFIMLASTIIITIL